jgi:protein-S-isoprenylcysteine O-methyltransferase Ste14
MKNKIITIALFILLAFILPLTANMLLLFTLQIGVLVVLAAVLLLTQPVLSIKETNQTKNSDKLSVLVILGACLFLQVFSVMEWAYFREHHHQFALDAFTSTGLILIIGGTAFRVWCIRTLGKFFTATVQTQTNQRIVKTGAYSVVRHPSYLGFYLAILGNAVFLHAYVGIMVTAVVMFGAYYYRIKVEEETLVKEFGEEYKTYQTETKKLFPFLY